MTDFQLDILGGMCGKPRLVDEPDADYARRLGYTASATGTFRLVDGSEFNVAPALWDIGWAVAADDIPARDTPDNPVHRAVDEVLRGLTKREIVPVARQRLVDALDKASKPETGRTADGSHRAPDSKAFRFGGVPERDL
jgi:hypothetical protein